VLRLFTHKCMCALTAADLYIEQVNIEIFTLGIQLRVIFSEQSDYVFKTAAINNVPM
jgi:hypothetical protein